MDRLLVKAFVLMFLVVAVSGCNKTDDMVYSEYVSLGNEGWDPVNVLVFSPGVADSVALSRNGYTLVLNVRYNQSCQAKELPMAITEESADGEISSEIVTVPLCDRRGRPLGKKSLVLYELSDTLRTNMNLQDGYWVEIVSMCPKEYTKGVTDIGLSLIKNSYD